MCSSLEQKGTSLIWCTIYTLRKEEWKRRTHLVTRARSKCCSMLRDHRHLPPWCASDVPKSGSHPASCALLCVYLQGPGCLCGVWIIEFNWKCKSSPRIGWWVGCLVEDNRVHLEPITAPTVPNTDDWLSVRRLCVCFPVRYATQQYFHSSPELGLLYVCVRYMLQSVPRWTQYS